MYQEILASLRPEMDKTIVFFQGELGKIRTGHATPSLVEDVPVNLSGQKMPLKQLAGISCPDRRQILIQPWEKSYVEPIEKALQASSFGSSPVVEGATIRVHLPQLSQEYRLQLAKVLNEKTEDVRKTIRKHREDAWQKIQDGAKQGKIREDDKFRAKDELQKLADEYIKKLEDALARKKQEIEVS
jgi:ribosome recycling factor